MTQFIYLDNNASTALDPRVLEAMAPYLQGPAGNASSRHALGRRARQAIDRAKQQISNALHTDGADIVFTSGATEANNLAVFSLADGEPRSVVVSPAEHSSVWEPIRSLAALRYHVAELDLDERGRVRDFGSAVDESAAFVAVQLANSETGVIQDVAKLASRTPAGCAFHCDAVQGIGRMEVDFDALGVTTLTISGHKIHGPMGIGALVARRGTVLRPLMLGGGQQRSVRPGTEPVAAVVGLGAAVELAARSREQEALRLATLRDKFEALLTEQIDRVAINGAEARRLPNTTNVSFLDTNVEALLMALDLAGVYCSAGTACASGSLQPSSVLAAMGLTGDRLRGALRFSLGRFTTEAQLEPAAARIADAVRRVRATAPLSRP